MNNIYNNGRCSHFKESTKQGQASIKQNPVFLFRQIFPSKMHMKPQIIQAVVRFKFGLHFTDPPKQIFRKVKKIFFLQIILKYFPPPTVKIDKRNKKIDSIQKIL